MGSDCPQVRDSFLGFTLGLRNPKKKEKERECTRVKEVGRKRKQEKERGRERVPSAKSASR